MRELFFKSGLKIGAVDTTEHDIYKQVQSEMGGIQEQDWVYATELRAVFVSILSYLILGYPRLYSCFANTTKKD